MTDAADHNSPRALTSSRGVREMTYRMRAQLALPDDPRYYWLCDRTSIEQGKPRSWRPAVLGELGRLLEEQGREALLRAADHLCQEQPDTRQALSWLRRLRLEQGEDRPLALTEAVVSAAEEHLARHPLSAAAIMAALDDAILYLCPDEG